MAKKPAEARVQVEFPEKITIIRKEGNVDLNRATLEQLYEQAIAVCKKSKRLSCYELMQELNVCYGVTILLADKMELDGFVDPMKEGECGPRKFKGK